MRAIDADELMVEISLIDLEERKRNGFNACVECIEQAPTVQFCEDAISREAVLNTLNKHWLNGTVARRIVDELGDSIKELSSIDPQPKTGHWIKIYLTDTGDIDGQCSECGFIHTFIDRHTAQYNHCPNCGAKMESEDKE